MSSLLYSVGRAAFRGRRIVAGVWVVVLLLVGTGAGLLSAGTSNSFVIPGTSSQAALDSLATRFPEVSGAQAQMVVVTPDGAQITDARTKDAVQSTVSRLEHLSFVTAVVNPYDQNVAGALSGDQRAAMTLLPAIFGFSGATLTPRPARGGRLRKSRRPGAHRVANAWVRTVTRWPALTIALVILRLGVLAIPAKDLRLALSDNGTAPAASTQRQAFDLVAQRFGPGFNAPLLVTADLVQTTDPVGVVTELAAELGRLPGVDQVTTATPNRTADTAVVVLIPNSSADSETTKDLVATIRGRHRQFEREYGVDVAVTGQTALALDVSDRLAGALLPFAILVVGLSLVLLGAVFRSIAVPIKATVGYLLSAGAAFGVVSAVFEWGWLAGPLGVERTGPVISFMPIILMGVLFGLAMDYEVFLVSRMREEYVHSGDPRRALTASWSTPSWSG